ncbi:MAG: DUF3046 domain-containing protein [Actinomycetota bacterium]|nr:DUF3046 domain-containing protein [Actinomycetota bacterium]
MRLSVFWTLMDDEFGSSYSRSVARDHTLLSLGDRTVDEAIEAGIPAREVWDAVCGAMDVAPEHRFGREPQQREQRQQRR